MGTLSNFSRFAFGDLTPQGIISRFAGTVTLSNQMSLVADKTGCYRNGALCYQGPLIVCTDIISLRLYLRIIHPVSRLETC